MQSGTGVPPRAGIATDIDTVAGKMARRFVPRDSPIHTSALTEPATVARGDALQVEVVSGNARLRFEGLAQASAGAGQVVPIRMRDTGRVVHARIAESGRAVVDIGGKH